MVRTFDVARYVLHGSGHSIKLNGDVSILAARELASQRAARDANLRVAALRA